MKIRYMSDLHLEFADFDIPKQDDDKGTILVLAGDIGVVKHSNLEARYIPFLKRASEQFRAVVGVIGNHEHYGGSFILTMKVLKEAIAKAELNNVHFLEKESIVFDDVAFIGATLWTDCGNRHEHAGHYFLSYMNDGRQIRTGASEASAYMLPFRAIDTINDHKNALHYIVHTIKEQQNDGKKIAVVVHHGVTDQSIHPKYRTGPSAVLNMFFASELTESWKETQPDLIFHGHTHESLEYGVDGCDTRVLVNPRGYVTMHSPAGENAHFNPLASVEL